MPVGFHRIILAQFLSALADNALLIVAIALLHSQGEPAWWVPMLKLAFNLFFVVLAPFTGVLADAWPKGRIMGWMNGIKLLAVLGMLLQVHPVLAYAVAGLGAAAYAPAKYGLITELVPAPQLVAANAWIELSVVGAALLGVTLGGALISPLMTAWMAPWPVLEVALLLVAAIYLAAAWVQFKVPDTGWRHTPATVRPQQLVADFWQAHRRLWRDAQGGVSLAVTTLFWGIGAVLQLAVLRWAGEVLQWRLDQAAVMQAVVALGVLAGAGVAGRWVPLARARRVLPLGMLLGLLTCGVAQLTEPWLAVPALVLLGAVGGLLVVPMNALLQHRGQQLFSAGRSIAVQGFNENLSVLLMLAAYAGVLRFEVPMPALMTGMGLLVALAMGWVWRWRAAPPLSRPPACQP